MSAASTLSLWLLNAGVIVVVASGAGPPLAAAFASIFIITRIPLLFQGSLQSIILASVVAHLNRGDIRGVRRTIHRSLALVGMSGVVTVVVFGLLADSWAAWLYGDRFQLGIVSSTGLALSTALFLVGAACHVMLVGLDASREATLAWIAGALAFGAVIWVGWGSPVSLVVSAYVTSAAVLIVVQAVLIRWVLARTALGISRA